MEKSAARQLVKAMADSARMLADHLRDLEMAIQAEMRVSGVACTDAAIDEWNKLINLVPRDLKVIKQQYLKVG